LFLPELSLSATADFSEVGTLKILVISNFYPPYFVGGYELGCRDVVEGLRARGHDVSVLTSTYGVIHPQSGREVYRWLTSDFLSKDRNPAANLLRLLKKERQNRQALKKLCRALVPDIIYIWNLSHISVSLALLAQELHYPVCYFVSDHWLSQWEDDAWYAQSKRRPKRLSRRLLWQGLRHFFKRTGLLLNQSLDLSQVQFASSFLKQACLSAGKPVREAEVIHWGVETQTFSNPHEDRNRLRLLYVGQLILNKGIQTAVEALKVLVEQYPFPDVSLTVVGGPDYDNRIQRLVSSLGLDGKVTFMGLLPRERLPEVYHQHGILIFPSVWDEPFSITLLEAMACGLAIVGTQTGGSFEILKDEVNALIFKKENAKECAEKIVRLMTDEELYNRIRQNGLCTVEQGHRLTHMITRIEGSLKKWIERSAPNRGYEENLQGKVLESSPGTAGKL
jgi:glycosyltransferase involved in cell wall biosynthesis